MVPWEGASLERGDIFPLMGPRDNRAVSHDSRFFGAVPGRCVEGEAFLAPLYLATGQNWCGLSAPTRSDHQVEMLPRFKTPGKTARRRLKDCAGGSLSRSFTTRTAESYPALEILDTRIVDA